MKARLAGATLVAATVGVCAALSGATGALAVPPPDVEAKLVALGRVVDAPGTTAIYAPMLANQSYDGVAIDRDQAYGTDPRAVLDVATPKARGKGMPVLIYVPGGSGNKRLDYPGGAVFY